MRAVLPALLLGLLLAVLAGCGREDVPAEEARAPVGAGTVALSAPAPGAGELHIVRLVARGDRYLFDPERVVVRQGDVVRFLQTGYQPEAVAFDPAAAPEGGDAFLRSHELFQGPLLTEPGVFFDVHFQDAPPGEYGFFSVPHRQRGMTGRVEVVP